CLCFCPLVSRRPLDSFLHDALPIFRRHHDDDDGEVVREEALDGEGIALAAHGAEVDVVADLEAAVLGVRLADPDALGHAAPAGGDRKSTRLNSSHVKISYAVFCLNK